MWHVKDINGKTIKKFDKESDAYEYANEYANECDEECFVVNDGAIYAY